jgi:ABC-2 type transport system permease protein
VVVAPTAPAAGPRDIVAVVAAWFALLTAWVFALALPIGWTVGMPGWSAAVALAGAADVAGAAGLTMALLTPTALLACAGRGYLAPLGFALMILFLAQVLADASHS